MGGLDVIVTALAAGATSGVRDAAASAVKEAGEGLRELLVRRLEGHAGAQRALTAEEPDPEVWRSRIGPDLEASGADHDERILAAARGLLDLAGVRAGSIVGTAGDNHQGASGHFAGSPVFINNNTTGASAPPAPSRPGRGLVVAVIVIAVALAAVVTLLLVEPSMPWASRDRADQKTITPQPSAGGVFPVGAPSAESTAVTTPDLPKPVGVAPPHRTSNPPAAGARKTSGAKAQTVVKPAGTIGTADDDVRDCAYFTGTARLPSGKTLILVKRNLDNSDAGQYVEFVFHWNDPARLNSWRGAQYFGQNDESAGQRYSVTLMAVNMSAAADARTAGGAAVNNLADGGASLASHTVRRVSGTVGNDCPGD